jgi:hypothetical protein
VTRTQLEHLLRAAGEIAADDEIVVIGSQARAEGVPSTGIELPCDPSATRLQLARRLE